MLGTEQVASSSSGCVGYHIPLSNVHSAYDYSDHFGFSGFMRLDIKIVLKNKSYPGSIFTNKWNPNSKFTKIS